MLRRNAERKAEILSHEVVEPLLGLASSNAANIVVVALQCLGNLVEGHLPTKTLVCQHRGLHVFSHVLEKFH